MSGGGKGGGGGTNWADLELDARRRADAEAERQRQAAAQAQRLADWRARRDSTRAQFGQRAQDVLTQRGLRPDELLPELTGALDRRLSVMPEGDEGIGSLLSDDFIANTLAGVRDNRRQRFSTEVANRFAPGSENNIFTLDMDDPIYRAVLDEQRNDAQQMLTRAQARGNLDASGFQRGMSRLDSLYSSGLSEADEIGNSIIQGSRERLRGVAGRAASEASGYELGRQFSIDPFAQEWDTLANTERGALEGRVRSALEGQQFFDIGDVITRAGIAQGAQNPNSAQADEIARRMTIRNAERGVGAGTGGGTF